jgi:phosphate transport system substrate-binding protein
VRRLLLACLSVAGLFATGPAKAQTLINGAGATFPYPLYSKWFSDYAAIDKSVHFNYQSLGSGAGIRQITDRTVDFGASDAPMSAEEISKAPGILHIPTVLGAVTLTYNLPGNPAVSLTPEALAKIFLGEITNWDDAAIKAANPGVALPTLPVAVVHRSDGSGTSAIFTDYLTKISPAWASGPGQGKSVRWPVGIGAKGNEGVTGQVKTLPGAIGYVELAYAFQNKLPVASLRNKSGAFVAPTIASITAAAGGMATQMPSDMRVSITDADGKDSYPISAFTYILVYREQSDAIKGPALAKFLRWATHEGQAAAAPLLYAPLPDVVVKKVDTKLGDLTLNGKKILQ